VITIPARRLSPGPHVFLVLIVLRHGRYRGSNEEMVRDGAMEGRFLLEETLVWLCDQAYGAMEKGTVIQGWIDSRYGGNANRKKKNRGRQSTLVYCSVGKEKKRAHECA
jgi:hypothetical protein